MTQRIIEVLNLSDEILWDIELNRISLEQIIYKSLRLARLMDDFDSVKWFNLEIHWYNNDKIVPGVSKNEYFTIAILHGRWVTVEDKKKWIEQRYWTTSIIELETNVLSNSTKLDKLVLPSSYQPAISSVQTEWYYSNNPLKTEFVQEKFQDVIQKIRTEQNTIHTSILQQKDILGRVKNSIYNYILWVNYKLKYSQLVQGLFEWRQKIVIDKLREDSNYNEIMSSIDNNLLSDNPQDLANAVHNCRRLLKQLADSISPVDNQQLEISKWSGKKKKIIKLWDENYVNRLVNYITQKNKSEKFQEIVWSHLDYIWNRLDAIYEASSKWTHAKVSKNEADRYVIFTYLLIADILEL